MKITRKHEWKAQHSPLTGTHDAVCKHCDTTREVFHDQDHSATVTYYDRDGFALGSIGPRCRARKVPGNPKRRRSTRPKFVSTQ